ncbi:MAG: two-component system response regulator [Candidatus Dadabacteria bacterium]
MSEREKILIVDDEEPIRRLLMETLEDLGYRCESLEDGLECIKRIHEGGNYDVVLLDIRMPKLNGIETLKYIKTYSSDISVVMISASREINDVRIALKEGAYDYLFKPFDINEVETVIRRAIERSQLIRQNRDYQRNLEKKVVEQTQELLSLYSDTLEAMISALDSREHETGYHSYRVTEYALTLAKQVGLVDSDLVIIARGALLHDIGKIGVPDSILLKPGELTEEEWKIMKKHPIFGYELLRKIHFLEGAANIVLTHHEHYDGGGYPYGLRGEEIPIGARIFSIVDAMDALTNDRIYRKGVSFDEARQRIISASGSQFDPEIVRVFLTIPREKWMELRKSIETSGFMYLKKLISRLSAA